MTEKQEILPLLRLVCPDCGAEMTRYVARGLLIGDGVVTVTDHVQICQACGVEHGLDSKLRFRVGPARSELCQ